ncbi:MAG: ribbon-helix-helix domain-containing protein [Candidatus Bathyarchaeia archaeon]
MPRKEIKGKWATVKIPEEMKRAVEEFLRTSRARALGFDSISGVVTAAVRELLKEEGYYEKKGF